MEMKCGQWLEELRSKIKTAEFHYLRCLHVTMENRARYEVLWKETGVIS
jgi:hypothetical protein